MTPIRRSAPSAAEIVFWLMAAMVIFNVKTFDELIGAGRAVSLPIAAALAACHLLLASLVLRLSWRRVMGTPGLLAAAALGSYLVLGAAASIRTGAGGWEYAPRYAYVLLGVVAAAVGAATALGRVGAEGLARGLLPLFGAASALVLASPWLPETTSMEADMRPLEWPRPAGLFGNPNAAGFAGCAAAALALPALRARRLRAPAGLALALGAAAAVATYSRTAIVTLTAVVLVFSALAAGGPRRRLLVGGLVLAGLAGAVFVAATAWSPAFPPYDRTNGPAIGDAGGPDRLAMTRAAGFHRLLIEDTSSLNRFYLLETAVSRAADRPILGSGFGAFHAMPAVGMFVCYTIGGFASCGAHNLFLAMAGEAGIVPPVLFLLFLAAAVRARLRSGPSLAGDAAAGWALVLAGDAMSGHAALIASPWNAFLIGLTCAAAAHAERSVRRGGAPRNAAN